MVTPLKRRSGYTRLSSNNQVTLPAALVAALSLEPGTEFRVEARDHEIVLFPEEDLASRRRRALADLAGSMPGVFEPGHLQKLRDEWR